MGFSALTLPRYPAGTLQRMYWWLVQVPWRGLGLYSPQALLALPAAYASSQFAAHHNVFPFPFNVMLGIAFEWVYLGTLAVAGARRDNVWYKVVNLVAVLSSVIYVTLHSAERYGLLDTFGSAGWLWAFSLIHGLPLATLNFFYGLLVHSHLKGIAEEEAAEQQAAAAAAAAVAHKCDWCGTGFASPAAVNGHKKGCPSRPQPIP